ncbi:MAG: hypothetical protein GY950_02300 [bacterium]|nr:hypothetical protein [bacterium]
MTYIFSFLFPFLLVVLLLHRILGRLGKPVEGWRGLSVIGILSALVVVVPVGGLPLGRWLMSLNANFSIPLTAVVFAKVWENAFGKELLDKSALRGAWVFGGSAGLLLYPMALGLGPFDPYSLGWEFSPFFILLMGVTIFFLYNRNGFGIVLMLCILAYHLRLLESPNLWDYFVDPFFAVVSFAALAKRLWRNQKKVDNSSIN